MEKTHLGGITMKHIITKELLVLYEDGLRMEEKSVLTVKKYLRDIRKFCGFAGENTPVTKDLAVAYKEYLGKRYALSSANSMLAALNSFFHWAGWADCEVRYFRVQAETFRSGARDLSHAEYVRLLEAAKKRRQIWLYLVMVTLASTGIRISELPYITVESLSCRRARVSNKGKTRMVVLPTELCARLAAYAGEKGIVQGSIFVTRSGKPIDRSNIYHAMKKLAQEAGDAGTKVFPHNLRHLFAVRHYRKNHDLAGLASILGHSSINTTRIYTMETIEARAGEINALGLVV
jgi:site-specific recombinase XerD